MDDAGDMNDVVAGVSVGGKGMTTPLKVVGKDDVNKGASDLNRKGAVYLSDTGKCSGDLNGKGSLRRKRSLLTGKKILFQIQGLLIIVKSEGFSNDFKLSIPSATRGKQVEDCWVPNFLMVSMLMFSSQVMQTVVQKAEKGWWKGLLRGKGKAPH